MCVCVCLCVCVRVVGVRPRLEETNHRIPNTSTRSGDSVGILFWTCRHISPWYVEEIL